MKLTRIEPFSKAAPGFNKAAAQQVYKAIMDCPDDESAAFMTRCIVFDVMNHDIMAHENHLTKAYGEYITKRAELIKKALGRQMLAKRLRGEDLAEIVKAAKYLDVLSKDVYSASERRENARQQRRNARGRFVREHTKLVYDRKQPVDYQIFQRTYGLPRQEGLRPTWGNGKELTDQELRNYQLAYQQISDMIGPFTNHPGAVLHLRYPKHEKQVRPQDLHHQLLSTKQTPLSAAVSVSDYYDTNEAPDFYGMIRAFGGSPATGARVQGLVTPGDQWERSGLNPDVLERYANVRDRDQGKYPYQPGNRLMSRLASGSNLLNDTLGPVAPPKVKAALAAGSYVGQYGPEAQRVLGPVTARTAYRYRGVERPPSDELIRAFNNFSMKHKEATPEEKIAELTKPQINAEGEETASPVISYFKRRLPKANLSTLQTASGVIPPSEGIILDKNGKIITQAVGYGDDWYLPFNLKNVSRLRGGSYIRTRTFGGPTTEDIYTGLISGARSITVVSHSGVYTVEFDKSFKGGRRYNDKAARMVGRYAQLLDAVGSGQVVLLDALDRTRDRELHDEALRNVRNPDDAEAVGAEYKRLVAAEAVHPKLSEDQKEGLRYQVVNEAAERVPTGRSGSTLTPDQFRDHLALRMWNNYSPETRQQIEASGQRQKWLTDTRAQLTDAAIIAADPKMQERYNRLERKAIAEQRRKMEPLRLNGEGYQRALEGLREQFPYYFAHPRFQIWEDAANKNDSGYVKPKSIRPDQALVGFFGAGLPQKIRASDAWEKTPTPARVPAAQEQEEAPARTQQAAAATETARTSGTDAVAQSEADLALAHALVDLKDATFNDNAPENLRGKKVSDVPFIMEPGHRDADENSRLMFRYTNMGKPQIERLLDEQGPEQFHRNLMATVDALERMGGLDLPRNLVERSRLRGKEPPGKEWPNDPWQLLIGNNINSEYRIHPRFEPGKHLREDLLDLYRTDPHIIAANLGEPEAEDFEEKANQRVAEARDVHRRLMNRATAYTVTPDQERNAQNVLQGVVKARHVRRRLGELPKTSEAAVPSASGEPQPERIVMGTPGSIAEALRIMNAEGAANIVQPPSPRAIENQPEESWLDLLKPEERKRVLDQLRRQRENE